MRVESVHRQPPRPHQQANCLATEVSVPRSVGTKPLFEARGTGATRWSERHLYPSLSPGLGLSAPRRFSEGDDGVLAWSRRVDEALDIGSFQYSPGTKRALHLCKALIFLVFLAPRPGLEPGTYGLTAPPLNRPGSRANARFPVFCCLIFPPSSAPLRPGSGGFGGRISDSLWARNWWSWQRASEG